MKYTVNNIDKVIADVEKKSGNALYKVWLYLEQKLKQAVEKDSYDTGQLARSINTQKISDEKVVVWTNLEYALIREYGRRPWRFPPLQSLVGWSSRKGIISWWATSKYEDLHYTDKGKIFVIARSIALHWIEWKHTFERTIKAEADKLTDLFIKRYK